MEFYRAVTPLSKAKKFCLFTGYPLLKFKGNISSDLVRSAIEKNIGVEVKLFANNSAMISPTRDKVIIHRHGLGYEKTAVKKSLSGVKKELEVYKLLNEKQPVLFQYSKLLKSESNDNFVQFLMGYAEGNFSDRVPNISTLLEPLAEFFSLAQNSTSWQNLWEELLAPYPNLGKYVSMEMKQGTAPTGLVHRDFKPWNVKYGVKPLFFDFESACFHGCPLEDFFNYTIDPCIRFEKISKVKQTMLFLKPVAEKLLNLQNIPVTLFERYRKWYILERHIFWRSRNQSDLAEKFLELYE